MKGTTKKVMIALKQIWGIEQRKQVDQFRKKNVDFSEFS